MKKNIILFTIFALAVLGYFLFNKFIGSINIPKAVPLANGNPNEITQKLIVPDGFRISVYAMGLPGARVLALDDKGRFFVSQTSEDKVSVIVDNDHDGTVDFTKTLVQGLDKPHGLAFKCEEGGKCFLYVAEQDALTRYAYDSTSLALGERMILRALPEALPDRHFTRTLLFLPTPDEDTLLVSIGSSCDVCHEQNSEQASVIAYNTRTGKSETYAKGLRNSVFMTLDPVDGDVVATEMGRDGLGDNLPPDEINILKKGKNYGWPICYGKNIHDDEFDKNTYIRNPCMEPFETPSAIDLQAHSAPLGLAFIPEEGWPEEYWYNLLVALHGSWNRSEPTGYKIERLKIDAKGEYFSKEDFITGWLTADGKKLGRPVDILVFPGGSAFISDDMNGIIYKLERN
jgi:glucose/arabinose dehydrogenase